MNSINYLNSVKKQLHIRSDYALAKAIGITRQAICNYRKERSQMDNFTAFKVAEVLDIPAEKVIIDVALEASNNHEKREFWYQRRGKFDLAHSI